MHLFVVFWWPEICSMSTPRTTFYWHKAKSGNSIQTLHCVPITFRSNFTQFYRVSHFRTKFGTMNNEHSIVRIKYKVCICGCFEFIITLPQSGSSVCNQIFLPVLRTQMSHHRKVPFRNNRKHWWIHQVIMNDNNGRGLTWSNIDKYWNIVEVWTIIIIIKPFQFFEMN